MGCGRASKKKYRLPDCHKPDGTVSGSMKRLSSRYYQLKAGHSHTGENFHWAKIRLTAQCWWCNGTPPPSPPIPND